MFATFFWPHAGRLEGQGPSICALVYVCLQFLVCVSSMPCASARSIAHCERPRVALGVVVTEVEVGH